MDVVVYDDDDKRYVPLLVAAVLALVAALVVGGLSYELGRRQPAQQQLAGVTPPQAAAAPVEQQCTEAIERANTALGVGDELASTLSEQTSLMDELLAGRATADEVVERALPPLTAGAKDRQAYVDAVAAYEQARDACAT